ncbi:glycosyltransferase family 4 protein [Nocardioides terrisoli]|uniref:glycosyltransferase family 4 protein n=1 Tax=Nocardioides terrisoli TaxID=3388267 RepID=UPI00287B866A|nr:glycosyltransferase family 4 protein [Nocardioides marmorisolisilvae]
MKVLVHDFSGHPFQAQLSRELARRGHDVVHSYCAAYVGGKGKLEARPDERVVFEPISVGRRIRKTSFARRLVTEIQIGFDLARQARRVKPDVVMVSTTPVPSMVVLAAVLWLRRTPWVLWHQDIQAVAIKSFAGAALSRMFLVAGQLIGYGERWGSRRAAAIVVIVESFLEVHRAWGTAEKATVIPNWAPLDEIYPVERKNDWAVEHGLDETKTLTYSGTLGLKHNPALLVQLARHVIDQGTPVRLVVVNEGPAVEVVRAEADRLDVPLTLLPFQPYGRLPEVLGSGDVLVVLLERTAGEFSVPSKTLSYLCAGRPVLGLMPPENLASVLVDRAGGCVLPPAEESLPAAARWVTAVLADDQERALLGEQARQLAEQEFRLASCADRFESILREAASGGA